MEVRYYCECYHRTLVIKFSKKYEWLRRETELMLDQFYDEWVNFEGPGEYVQDMCLEEYMMERLSETYNIWYKSTGRFNITHDICNKWNVEEDENFFG